MIRRIISNTFTLTMTKYYQNKQRTNNFTGIVRSNQVIWLRKFNFQSLLNTPHVANLYGPLVNLWEGSNQEEGYLRYVKHKITSVHNKKWNLNVHINLLNDNALHSVFGNHFTAEASDDTNRRFRKVRMERLTQSTMFYKYNNVNELFSCTSNINQYLL